MPEIKPEYPRGKRGAEMVLVKMLQEKRSWTDYMDITDALWNLRHKAKLMQDEHNIHNANSGGREAENAEA